MVRLSEISNTLENADRYAHFSIDDISSSLKDINANQSSYLSIFDNVFFCELRELHIKYGACFTLYIFGISKIFDVTDFTTKFDAELLSNADWIQFGYHGVADSLTDKCSFKLGYEKYSERFKKASKLQTDTLRLHRWSIPTDFLKILSENGVKCLLTADRNTESYNLNKEQTDMLCKCDVFYEEILYKRTDLRIERIMLQTYKWLPKYKKRALIIFTHEHKWNRNKIEPVLKWLYKKNYTFIT